MQLTEGLGSANTKESKYVSRDGFSMKNTVLKMAKKRAQVDATLTIGRMVGDKFVMEDGEIIAGITEKPATEKVTFKY
ncbi:hypothetical protein WP50_12425, partial [Lactiplantibacillus plantarum]